MSDNTKIEWTEATWNPIRARAVAGDGSVKTGWHCVHASEGCRNCYAESFNKRLGTGFDYKPGYLKSDVEVYLDEKMLLQPLKWKKARQIFVCSMTDLFADFVTDEQIDRIFAVMALCPQHIFQVLTKRSARMRAYMTGLRRAANICPDAVLAIPQVGRDTMVANATWPLPNVWLGVSVENQAAADERIPDLLATPAALRWLSCEPLLGPVDLRRFENLFMRSAKDTREVALPFVDWIVAGGESGRSARPMHPDWARRLRDQCAAADVPFFFKQWGEWGEDGGPQSGKRDRIFDGKARCAVFVDGRWEHFPDGFAPPIELATGHGEWLYHLGKKAAGRLLDGVLHDGMPG